MRWRMIGPFRGGRTPSVVGVPSQPNVFYMGVNNGGVWKTTDFGQTWQPIFDDQPTGSIGALAVAPSDPNIIYVGSGEGLQRPDLSVGDGIYKSTDAGKTWQHLGLRDGQQISVHRRRSARSQSRLRRRARPSLRPERRSAACSAPPTAARPGRRFCIRMRTPARARSRSILRIRAGFTPCCGPRANFRGKASANGPGSGLFMSTDGGTTWRQLTARSADCRRDGLGPMSFGIAPSESAAHVRCASKRSRNGGFYRSDDAGENWQRVSNEARVIGRGGDTSAVTRRSEAIATWSTSPTRPPTVPPTPARRSPRSRARPAATIINPSGSIPTNPEIIALGVDQGATISRQRRRNVELVGTTSRPRSSIT